MHPDYEALSECHRRERLALGLQDARDHRIEFALADGKRTCDGRPHRDLDANHDLPVAGRLDDPAESVQHDLTAAGGFGVFGARNRSAGLRPVRRARLDRPRSRARRAESRSIRSPPSRGL